MKIAYHALLFSAQAGVTFVALLGVYLLLALLEYRGGFPAFVGLFTFQPVLGALFSFVTVGICALLGLPLRLAAFGHWWRQRALLVLGGAAAGGMLLPLALLLRDATNPPASNEPFVLGLAGSGWFLLAFCLLHVFPPDAILRRVGLLRVLYDR